MEIGTIIRIKYNINNYPEKDGYNWKYIDYELRDGKFELCERDGELIGKFDGKHFVVVKSEYYEGMVGSIYGLEILDKEYEIINP